MRAVWGNFWSRSLVTLVCAAVLSVGITTVYQMSVMLTDIFRMPVSAAVVFMFAGQALIGLAPIWGLGRKLINRIPRRCGL